MGCCEHPPVSPELQQGSCKAFVKRRAQVNIGNTGKVKRFSPFSFPPLPFDRDVAKGFLMSQALFSGAFFSFFPLLHVHVAVFPNPSQKAVFLLPAASQLVGD